MKKLTIILMAAVLVVGLMPITSFAHGHGGSKAVTSTYRLCDVENCDTTGNHKHNGTTYAGHSKNDGHAHHNTGSGCQKNHH